MKPFDLEAAKRGEPIVTRDGRSVVFVAHDPSFTETHRVIVRVEGTGSPRCYAESGEYYKNYSDDLDLFMVPRKRTAYVNVYGVRHASRAAQHSCAFDSEADAIRDSEINTARLLAVAVPVEIEV